MIFFSEQPVSKEVRNNEEKINTTTKGNNMKKVQVQQQKECKTKIKKKTLEQRSSNQKYLTCEAKQVSRYQTNILCGA